MDLRPVPKRSRRGKISSSSALLYHVVRAWYDYRSRSGQGESQDKQTVSHKHWTLICYSVLLLRTSEATRAVLQYLAWGIGVAPGFGLSPLSVLAQNGRKSRCHNQSVVTDGSPFPMAKFQASTGLPLYSNAGVVPICRAFGGQQRVVDGGRGALSTNYSFGQPAHARVPRGLNCAPGSQRRAKGFWEL